MLCLLLVLGSVALSVGAETEATDQPTDQVKRRMHRVRLLLWMKHSRILYLEPKITNYLLPYLNLNDGWSFVDEDDAIGRDVYRRRMSCMKTRQRGSRCALNPYGREDAYDAQVSVYASAFADDERRRSYVSGRYQDR